MEGTAPLTEKGNQILREADLVSVVMSYVGGTFFLVTAIYITLDIMGRFLFHVSTGVAEELGCYGLLVGGSWALAYTLRTGGHVRIDILLPYFSQKTRDILQYLAIVLTALFASIVAWSVWHLALECFIMDTKVNSLLQTPLFIPQVFLAFGLTMLAFEAILILIAGLVESISARSLISLEKMLGWE